MRVTVNGEDGVALDAVLNFSNHSNSAIGIIFTHPYPYLGGSMNDHLVYHLSLNLSSLGFTTICFNMRGVGESGGKQSWTGQKESEDVVQVCKYLLNNPHIPVKEIILCGYSYGSIVAMPAVERINECVGFIGISCPFSVSWALTFFHTSYYLEYMKSTKHKLFLLGDMDNFISVDSFNSYIEQFNEPKVVRLIQGCDHFFFKEEQKVFNLITEWMREHKFLKNI